MERCVYPPYSGYQGLGGALTPGPHAAPRPPCKQPSWKQSKSSGGALNPYRGVSPAPPSPSADCLDTYKRAQLKALLSQVSPGLAPRLRKANTREVGVQVNPRVDAAVQCSLGARPLQAARPPSPSGRRGRDQPLPGPYSPVPAARRLCALREAAAEPEEEEEAAGDGPPEDCDGQPGQAQGAAAPKGAGEGRRTAFQFLEQKYGYFHCNDCKTRWESAYVWCISGTNKVYFKQLCRKCQKSFNPYKVEAIQCQYCYTLKTLPRSSWKSL
ncbi:protein ZAR1-like isoform X2 [Tiliqua scincoides]|uniref:protein ZAR1-like isoform X2 n=1 Tax=Tiliqua scincoides TaxID=71010 RepID=UPI0034622433